jgi:glutamate--cysteine ligase
MRGADSGLLPNLLALPALWVGLLYDETSLDAAWDLAKTWSAQERQKLRDDVPKQGLAAKIQGRTIFEIASEVLKASRAGLARRKHFDLSGQDETRYLEVLEDRIARGVTPAEELLAKYHGPWGGSVEPIYTEEAY